MSKPQAAIFPEELIFEKKPSRAVIFVENLTKEPFYIRIESNTSIRTSYVHLPARVDPETAKPFCCVFSPSSEVHFQDSLVEISISKNKQNFVLVKAIPIIFVEKWSLSKKTEAMLEK